MSLEPDIKAALKEFFQLLDDGLTSRKLDEFFDRCEENGGPEFREVIEQHVKLYHQLGKLVS